MYKICSMYKTYSICYSEYIVYIFFQTCINMYQIGLELSNPPASASPSTVINKLPHLTKIWGFCLFV